jgi:hypothetical protein
MNKEPKLFNTLQPGDFFTIGDQAEVWHKINATQAENDNTVKTVTPFILCFKVNFPVYNQVSAIIAFESGELDDAGTIELFQHLIDSGLAWQLQGSYGRTAAQLIERGYCLPVNVIEAVATDVPAKLRSGK